MRSLFWSLSRSESSRAWLLYSASGVIAFAFGLLREALRLLGYRSDTLGLVVIGVGAIAAITTWSWLERRLEVLSAALTVTVISPDATIGLLFPLPQLAGTVAVAASMAAIGPPSTFAVATVVSYHVLRIE